MENLMIVIMTAAVSLLTSLTCWLIVGPHSSSTSWPPSATTNAKTSKK